MIRPRTIPFGSIQGGCSLHSAVGIKALVVFVSRKRLRLMGAQGSRSLSFLSSLTVRIFICIAR